MCFRRSILGWMLAGWAAVANAAEYQTVQAFRLDPSSSVSSLRNIYLSTDCHQKGGIEFEVELALNEKAQAKGLSGRKVPLAHSSAMLFVFDPPKSEASFWMKDTHIPLQLIYFSPAGKALSQHDLVVEPNPSAPAKFYPAVTRGEPIGYALEFSPQIQVPLNSKLCFPKAKIDPNARQRGSR